MKAEAMGLTLHRSVEDLDFHLWSIPPLLLRAIEISDTTAPKALMESVSRDISDRYPDLSGTGFLSNVAALSLLVSSEARSTRREIDPLCVQPSEVKRTKDKGKGRARPHFELDVESDGVATGSGRKPDVDNGASEYIRPPAPDDSNDFEEDVVLLEIDTTKRGGDVKVLVSRFHGFELHEGSIRRVTTDAKLNCEVVNCYIE